MTISNNCSAKKENINYKCYSKSKFIPKFFKSDYFFQTLPIIHQVKISNKPQHCISPPLIYYLLQLPPIIQVPYIFNDIRYSG